MDQLGGGHSSLDQHEFDELLNLDHGAGEDQPLGSQSLFSQPADLTRQELDFNAVGLNIEDFNLDEFDLEDLNCAHLNAGDFSGDLSTGDFVPPDFIPSDIQPQGETLLNLHDQNFQQGLNFTDIQQDTPDFSSTSLPNAIPETTDLDNISPLPTFDNGSNLSYNGQPLSFDNVPPLPSFDDFPSWLPGFCRPSFPCDYCAAKGLNCYFTNGDAADCSSCKSLYRTCTFRSQTRRSGWIDTFGPVAEDHAQTCTSNVGTRPLFSQGASMFDILNDNDTSCKPDRTGLRFPTAVTLVLKRWLEAHAAHPYPTEAEKFELRQETGLSSSQIQNWLANARRRAKARPRPKRCVSPSVTSRCPTQPIPIQAPPAHADMNPFERWKHSPPEKDAPIDLIKEAAATTQYDVPACGSSSRSHSQNGRTLKSSGAGSWRPSSTSSVAERTSSRASTNGSDSIYSRNSRQSQTSSTQRRRRRNAARKPLVNASSDPKKIYQCTFCTDTFHIKYDWTRHEKSLHLSLERWICGPLGPVIAGPSGALECVYCGEAEPSQAHLDTHAHHECQDKPPSARTFYRKDHLRQHLRLVHHTPLIPSMDAWRSSPPVVNSRCGFCPDSAPTTFTTWQARADHLALHFRAGRTMAEWRGDWGLDPDIQARLLNAMPPFLIAHEARTPNPFSAESGCFGLYANLTDDVENGTDVQDRPHGKISTCWEILTAGLGKHVRRATAEGRTPDDAELQREARILLFGDDDEWNSTVADNAEWLRLFKQAHGIAGEDALPSPTMGSCPGEAGAGKDLRCDSGRGSSGVGSSGLGPATPADGVFAFDDEGEDEEFARLFKQAGIFGDVEMGFDMEV